MRKTVLYMLECASLFRISFGFASYIRFQFETRRPVLSFSHSKCSRYSMCQVSTLEVIDRNENLTDFQIPYEANKKSEASLAMKKSTLNEAAHKTEDSSFNKVLVGFLKGLLDSYYGDRHYARFYALETIARVPYFSYLSVLHLYETMGWWRKANYLKIHFAESWNELHHLLIMEELGGHERFTDRLIAQHTAFFYYWFVCMMYAINPQNAYNLNQHVEEHAYSTYDKFLSTHGEELKSIEAPEVGKKYYSEDKIDQSFEELDTSRPVVESLYDVFVCIREDEAEHVLTMAAMQDSDFT